MVSESDLTRTISAVSKAPAGITDDRLRYVIGFCNLKDQNLWVNTEKAGRVSLARALRGMMVTSLLAGTDEDALEITNSIDKVTARQYVAKPSGEPQLAKNAPADQPIRVNAGGQDRLNEMLQRHISEARATYPAAKSRYLKGLAKGEIFFVTTRIKDSAGRFEQSFIRVDSVKGSKITGRIANQISLVQGYRAGDVYTLDESDVVDWTITKPDGTEEGNFVGKFLDSIQK